MLSTNPKATATAGIPATTPHTWMTNCSLLLHYLNTIRHENYLQIAKTQTWNRQATMNIPNNNAFHSQAVKLDWARARTARFVCQIWRERLYSFIHIETVDWDRKTKIQTDVGYPPQAMTAALRTKCDWSPALKTLTSIRYMLWASIPFQKSETRTR